MNWRMLILGGIGFSVILGGTLYMRNMRENQCFDRGGHVKPVGYAFLCLTPDGRIM
jgi:hypothetical protein